MNLNEHERAAMIAQHNHLSKLETALIEAAVHGQSVPDAEWRFQKVVEAKRRIYDVLFPPKST